MLGAALCMLVLVSAFVAFGSWPGETSGKQVDQVLLNEVTKSQKPAAVAVGPKAVAVARAETKRKLDAAAKRAKKRGGPGRTNDGNAVAKTPAGTVPTTGGEAVAQAPAGGGGGGATDQVRQQTQNVTDNVKNTAGDVTNQVGNTVDNTVDTVGNTVDQTTTQVNQVVDQVGGAVQNTTQQTTTQVQSTVDDTTKTVTDTVGGLLGH
jgi:uncharacterized protein YjbJ (UPF0337 family)